MDDLIVDGDFINTNYPELYHFSWNPLFLFKVQYSQRPHLKPGGLWFSNEKEGEYSWSRWSCDEEYSIGKYRNKIIFKKEAKILTLTNDDDIKKFTDNFYISDPSIGFVNWMSVYNLSDVIFITPYSWDMRLSDRIEDNWYYGWDCASGCIMNLNALVFDFIDEPICDKLCYIHEKPK